MEAIYLLAGASALLAAVYYYLTSSYGYWEKQGVPTIKGAIPGIGNMGPMLLMQKNFPILYRDFYNQTPAHSMVGFYAMSRPALLLKDPELVKSVLQVNFSSFHDNEMTVDPKLDPLMAANPFFLKGEPWKNTRKQFSSAFSSGKLKSLWATVDSACSELTNYLKQKIPERGDSLEMEMKELFSRYTAEVVATAAFGVEGCSLKGDKEGPFREVGKKMFDPTFTKGIIQMIVFFIPVLGKLLKISFMPPDVDAFFRKVVNDVLKYREDEGVRGNDFLQILIDFKKSESKDYAFGTEFNEKTITSHAFSFFLDVYESSSVTLTFLSYNLAKSPEIQQRVREEIQAVMGKHDGLTYNALQEMTYLDKVIQESLRLNPTLGALIKVCTTAADLEGSDGIKCHVTTGTPVIIPVAALQMDSKHWPDPEKFDPDRFSEENKQKRHKFSYLPFGEGPRLCVGMKMALLLMKAATVTILSRYTLEVSPRVKEPLQLDPNYFLLTVAGGMWVKIKRL